MFVAQLSHNIGLFSPNSIKFLLSIICSQGSVLDGTGYNLHFIKKLNLRLYVQECYLDRVMESSQFHGLPCLQACNSNPLTLSFQALDS